MFGSFLIGVALRHLDRGPAAVVREERPDGAAAGTPEEVQFPLAGPAREGLQHRVGVGTGLPLLLGHGLCLRCLLRRPGKRRLTPAAVAPVSRAPAGSGGRRPRRTPRSAPGPGRCRASGPARRSCTAPAPPDHGRCCRSSPGPWPAPPSGTAPTAWPRTG